MTNKKEQNQNPSRIKITPLFVISLSLLLIATLAPVNGKIAGNYLDKVAHFLLFAFMTYQAMKALINKIEISAIIIWSILLSFMTEILQQFILGRNLDFYDALANTMGVVAAFYFFKFKNKKPQ